MQRMANLTKHELPIVTSGQMRVEVEGFGASQKNCPIYIRIPCLRNGSVIKAVRRTCAPAIIRLKSWATISDRESAPSG